MNQESGIQRKKVVRIILRLIPYSLFLIPVIIHAAAKGLIPCGGPGETACKLKDMFQMLVNIYNYLLGLASLVAMLFLIIGGIQLFAFSEQGSEKIVQGKQTITRAIFGLVIIACAYVIVNTVMVWLGVTNAADYFLGRAFGN